MSSGRIFGVDEDGDPNGPTNAEIEEKERQEKVDEFWEQNPDATDLPEELEKPK